jgi:molybdate transport system substrate-binding protein
MKHFNLIGVLFLLTILLLQFSLQADESTTEGKTLKVYCAAGMKVAFEKAAKEFEKLYKIEIVTDFKGSGHLMGSIKLNPVGDLFIAADSSYTTLLKDAGMIKETLPLAEMHPVIVVQKGNPKGIKTIADFKRDDVKVVLANPEAASIGNVTKKILVASKDWDAISSNTTKNGVFKPTVTEMANDIKMKAIDTAIIWDATAKQKIYANDFEIIEADILKSSKEFVTIGVLSNSKNPTLALKFARFLHAKDKGQKFFLEEGFSAIPNADLWEDQPTITLFSGGVNRTAIEKTIVEFKKRRYFY